MATTLRLESAPRVDVCEHDTALIIEDDDDYAALLSALVTRNCGPDVVRCADLASGIRAMGDRRFVAALVDLGLPDAEGLDVVNALLDVDRDLPIVVLTGTGNEQLGTNAIGAGAQDYLIKGDVSGDTIARSIRHGVARAGAEADLRKRTAQLQASNEDLSEFSSAVAHDLRAPVRTTRLLVDRLIERADFTDEVARDLAARIDESLLRLDRTVLGLLDYSMARDEHLDIGHVDLQRVVASTVDGLRADLTDCRAEIDIGRLPPVLGSPELIGTIIQNLVENSIKYRRPGHPPRISITATSHRDSMVCVEVSDNGIGIAEEHRSRVFNLLERLHSHHAIAGLGLGLALCRRMVARLGGRIWIEDSPLPGTVVRFTLSRSCPTGSTLQLTPS